MKSKRVHMESANGHQDSRMGPGKVADTGLRTARDKITRVFRYLEALNQHRNPVQRPLGCQLWSLWLHDLPCHPCIQRGVAPSSPPALPAQDTATQSNGENFVFRVQRPKLS